MKKSLPAIIIILLCILSFPSQGQWKLVWSDEFEEVIGPDWVLHVGTTWNNELQYYRKENASVVDGNLVIKAQKEDFGGRFYTSARLRTQGKVSWRYGRLEARIKLPAKQGSWPAFWTLGDVGQWPNNGEIDIMEHINTTTTVHANMHWSNNGSHTMREKKTTGDVTEYNVYAIEWSPLSIKWFFNDLKYHEVSITNSVSNTQSFHKKHHILVNMAVGGDMPKFVIDEVSMPWEMVVDYVRVYADTTLVPATSIAIEGGVPTLLKNRSINCTAKILPENTTHQTVTWSSSNAAVAMVNQGGQVTSKAPGTAIIYARTADLVTSFTITVTEDTTSIDEVDATSFISIYPNPVSEGRLMVKLKQPIGASTLQMVDLNGRVLISRSMAEEESVELSAGMNPGVYFLRVINNNKVFTRRFCVVE